MNQNQSIVIIVISAFIAVGGVSSSVKATNRKKRVENEIANLHRQLADLQNQMEQPKTKELTEAAQAPKTTNNVVTLKVPTNNVTATHEPTVEERHRRESFEDRMARMKQENPERYTEWIKRRIEFCDTMKYNVAERTATFIDLDTSRMSDKERVSHEQLVEQMDSIWQLIEKMGNPKEMSQEDLGNMFHKTRKAVPLLDHERSTMFRLLGEDLGYDAQGAQDFSNYINSIIEATSDRIPGGWRER